MLLDYPAIRRQLRQRRHTTFGPQRTAIIDRAVAQPEAGLVGIDHGGRRGVDRGQDRFGQIGLFAQDLLPLPAFHARNALDATVFHELVQHGQLRLVRGHGQLADTLEAEAQFVAEPIPHTVAGPLQFALERIGRGVVTAVNDAAVGFARAKPDFRFLLQ